MNNFFLIAELILNNIILTQGLVFGYVILKGVKKQHHLLYLALLIVFYSLDSVDSILETIFEILKIEDYFILMPLDFSYFMSPLLYIFVQKIPAIRNKVNYNILYFGIIGYLITLILFFLPIKDKLIIESSIFYFLFGMVSVIYSVFCVFKSYKFLKNKKKELKNLFFENYYSEVKWSFNFVKLLLVSFIVLFFAVVAMIFFQSLYHINSSVSTFVFAFLDAIFLYVMIIQGLKHKYLNELYDEFFVNSKKVKVKNQKKIDEEIVEFLEILKLLNKYLQTSQAFKNNNFSITDASLGINIHPKKISSAINLLESQNFSSFINKFRIEEAKKILEQNVTLNYSIEGIGSLVGFNSKSVFYKEFKKNTGVTPLKYFQNMKLK